MYGGSGLACTLILTRGPLAQLKCYYCTAGVELDTNIAMIQGYGGVVTVSSSEHTGCCLWETAQYKDSVLSNRARV